MTAYYIARIDANPFRNSIRLKRLKKKRFASFLTGFPELEKVSEEIMSLEKIVERLRQYNA
jgi:predicted metalloprotease